jgi:hypothetical protein
MRATTLNAACSPAAGLHVILLPGAFHFPEQFVQAGFDTAARAHNPQLELTVAIPELAHLTDRDWIAALHDEIVAPARRRASAALWLGGVSLGGFRALRFAAQYPAAIDGLCLLAPYLGSRLIASDISACTDIAAWEAGVLDEDDDERRIWRYVAQLGQSARATQIFLGYGRTDRFCDTQQILARVLPAVRSVTRVIEGGHDWPVWRGLWDQFLQCYGTPT